MTSILDRIAGHAFTVPVAGEDIRLRLPTPKEKADVLKLIPREGRTGKMTPEQQDAWIDAEANIGPKCLKATVLDHDHFTEETWGQIITASVDNPDDWPGLVDLVQTAMKLCGVKGGDTGEGVTDMAEEVDEVVGDVPTE